ncbi:MAG: metallophosphoesterase [Bacteroidetes bacterium]|nr:metallophosphoesterase [Bacteroidota bacterium]
MKIVFAKMYFVLLLILFFINGYSFAQTSVQLSGSKTCVVVPFHASFQLSQFTIECWFKRTGKGSPTSTGSISAYPLVTRGRAEGDGPLKDINYFLGIEENKEVLCADFEADNSAPNPGKNNPLFGITRIANDVWYHAAITFDGTNFCLYLNGNLEAQLSVTNQPQTLGLQNFCIGSAKNSSQASSGTFLGQISEVKLWNTALSSTFIKANLFTQGIQNAALVARWPMNDGSGLTIRDSSGNNRSGSIEGSLSSWVNETPFTTLLEIVRGPYIQQISPTSSTICWRTNIPSTSLIRYSTNWQVLPDLLVDNDCYTDHKLILTGLIPGKKYYYSIGSTTKLLQRDSNNNFVTTPLAGNEVSTVAWITGEIGTGKTVVNKVYAGAKSYFKSRVPDLWINAGNLGYSGGTDEQYQSKFFSVFSDWLKKVCIFPTLGLIDYGSSVLKQTNHAIAYNDIFHVQQDVVSGIPSNRKEYYSFDHGDVHFIVLDAFGIESNLKLVDTTSAQAIWLKNDLAATNLKWKVVSMGMPFYTKGSFDGDTDSLMIRLRSSILPILERNGVDLVFSGGSYAYERSYLLNGLTGTAADYKAWKHRVSSSKAKYDGSPNSCPYVKESNSNAKGTVYVTLGTSGQRGSEQVDFPFPAMVTSKSNMGGSMILEVRINRLDASWVREDGLVGDRFTMFKDVNDTIVIPVNTGQQVKLEAPWVGNYYWPSNDSTCKSQSLNISNASFITVVDSLNCIQHTWQFNLVGQDPSQIILSAPANLSCCNPTTVGLKVIPIDPNGNAMTVKYYGRKRPFQSTPPAPFSIIGLPDTQFYTSEENGGSNSFFKAQMDWTLAKKDSLTVSFISHYGDCVEHGDNNGDKVEWIRADSAFKIIENPVTTQLPFGIPYSVCVGNHDQTPNGDPNGATTLYNQYFGSTRFSGRNYYGGHYGSNNDNHYELFSVNGYNFIAISLEYDEVANGSVLAWADALLKTYINRRAIITSHFLLDIKGNFSAQGLATFNALKNNPNLFLILCGHIGGEAQRTDTVNGNLIHTLMADFQTRLNGGTGWMNILQFVPAENRLKVKTYSPLFDIYETDQNSEFELPINLFETFKLIGTNSNVASNSFSSLSWPGLALGSYEWYVEVSDGTNIVVSPIWDFTVTGPSPRMEQEVPLVPKVRIIPNPVLDSFSIDAGENDVKSVQVFSMQGWFLMTASTFGPTDISSLSSGSYMVRVLLKNGLRCDLLLVKY